MSIFLLKETIVENVKKKHTVRVTCQKMTFRLEFFFELIVDKEMANRRKIEGVVTT